MTTSGVGVGIGMGEGGVGAGRSLTWPGHLKTLGCLRLSLPSQALVVGCEGHPCALPTGRWCLLETEPGFLMDCLLKHFQLARERLLLCPYHPAPVHLRSLEGVINIRGSWVTKSGLS